MYDYFPEVSKDVGLVCPYSSCLILLRQTHDSELTVTTNRASSSATDETCMDTDGPDTERASSIGEEYGIDVASIGNGCGPSG